MATRGSVPRPAGVAGTAGLDSEGRRSLMDDAVLIGLVCASRQIDVDSVEADDPLKGVSEQACW